MSDSPVTAKSPMEIESNKEPRSISGWLDERTGWKRMMHEFLDERIPRCAVVLRVWFGPALYSAFSGGDRHFSGYVLRPFRRSRSHHDRIYREGCFGWCLLAQRSFLWRKHYGYPAGRSHDADISVWRLQRKARAFMGCGLYSLRISPGNGFHGLLAAMG